VSIDRICCASRMETLLNVILSRCWSRATVLRLSKEGPEPSISRAKRKTPGVSIDRIICCASLLRARASRASSIS
jgi:hypothetical protein